VEFVSKEKSYQDLFERDKGLFGIDGRYTLGEKFSAARKCKEFNLNSMDIVGQRHLSKKCKCTNE